VEEGADTIVWLASEAPQNLTGKFLRDRKEIPWCSAVGRRGDLRRTSPPLLYAVACAVLSAEH